MDDLKYLSDNDIDRNKVSLEIARIFSQMVHLNGWFHAVRDLLNTLSMNHAKVLLGPTSREPSYSTSPLHVTIAVQL